MSRKRPPMPEKRTPIPEKWLHDPLVGEVMKSRGRRGRKRRRPAGMPQGAIAADQSKHAPHNSYSPPQWYEDQRNTCVDCGAEFIFTAKEQQHWYEVLRLPIHVQGIRCAPCRAKRRGAVEAQKEHMAEMAARKPHPNAAFFRKKACSD